jgi:hypothetical protein
LRQNDRRPFKRTSSSGRPRQVIGSTKPI